MKKSAQKPVVLNEKGVTQRSDLTLNKEISLLLAQYILTGNSLFSAKNKKRGFIELPDGEGEVKVVRYNTVVHWLTRGNVVPETGKPLRELLEQARETVKLRKREEMDRKREHVIDRKLNRAISMRTKEPVVGMFGVIKHPETKKPLMRENPKLLAEQMKNVRWLAERLYPERYGVVERSENKHLLLSLADLRAYEEARRQQT